MKTARILTTAIAFTSLVSFSANAQSRTNTIINTGKSVSYDLKANDSLVIAEGTFKGSINSFENGAKINVLQSASFEPASFNNPKGTLLVYGSAKLNDLNTNKGFRLDNYAVVTIKGSTNMNGGEQYFYNYFNATINFKGDVSMNSDASLQNEGTINSGTNFTLNKSSSLVNKGTLAITNNMNVNSANFSNEGKAATTGSMTFNSGSTITNTCRMISDGGITNNGTGFYNSGLIWITAKTAGSRLTNNGSGTITNLSNATIKTVNLTNYGTIIGSGKIYATGNTIGGGTFGTSDKTTDTIKVYEATRTTDKTIFDEQYGKVNNNVVFAALTAPDTTSAFKSCSSVYMSLSGSSVILPVKWNYFTVKQTNTIPVLDWVSEHEPGTIYEAQRSYDNRNFTTIAKIAAKDNETIFQVADVNVDKNNTIVYYRIKGTEPTGEQKFTEIKTVKFNTTTTASLQVSPNPFTSQFTITMSSENNEAMTIKIYNSNGQLQVKLVKNASVGSNRFTISEVASLNRGMYIVEISNGQQIISAQKIVKQ